MTQEEKAKRYDEAIEKAREINDKGTWVRCDSTGPSICEQLFPELKEYEDERIRKGLIEHLNELKEQSVEGSHLKRPEHYDAWIAWLEKQKEENPLDGTLGDVFDDLRAGLDPSPKQGEQKPTDKVEPKFHEGDWITNGIFNARIIRVREDTYSATTESGDIYFPSYKDINDYHLWTIEDAKDGDVIFYDSGWTCIFKYIHGIWFSSYCFITAEGEFYTGYEEHVVDTKISGNAHPATKEQRDLLFQKMREAGYEWDAEKKELKGIKQQPSQWSISDYKTWQHIVSDVLTKYNGIGQYLDNEFCKNIAKYMQENWSKKLKG